VHQRQAVDQHRHVVTVRARRTASALVRTLAPGHLVLVDDLEPVVVDIRLVDERDVLGRPVVAPQDLDVILLDAQRLLDGTLVGAGDTLPEEPLPFAFAERDPVERLELPAQVRDELGLARERQVLVGLSLEDADELPLQRRLGLIRRLVRGLRDVLGDDRALGAHDDGVVAHIAAKVDHAWPPRL